MNAGERRSKRSRRGSAEVRAGAGHTLWQLKLRIVEALGVHPRNALVHVMRAGGWTQLDADTASLAGAGPCLHPYLTSSWPFLVVTFLGCLPSRCMARQACMHARYAVRKMGV